MILEKYLSIENEGIFIVIINNLPPKDITPIKGFENDVMGITPINESQIDNSNN